MIVDCPFFGYLDFSVIYTMLSFFSLIWSIGSMNYFINILFLYVLFADIFCIRCSRIATDIHAYADQILENLEKAYIIRLDTLSRLSTKSNELFMK